jgi:ferredoxin
VADRAERWPENTPGAYFVDRECIDCDLCRTIAPDNFGRSENGYSYVSRQPENEQEVADCVQATAECPVVAIGDETDS